MVTKVRVPLKHRRGSIKSARLEYGQALNSANENEYRAWIYLGKGETIYAEMQATVTGHYDIRRFYELSDEIDQEPRYIDMGRLTHRDQIKSLKDWRKWLKEYVSDIDPRDAFRTYRKIVVGR